MCVCVCVCVCVGGGGGGGGTGSSIICTRGLASPPPNTFSYKWNELSMSFKKKNVYQKDKLPNVAILSKFPISISGPPKSIMFLLLITGLFMRWGI